MSTKKTKTLRIVVVEWVDAVSRDAWEDADVALPPSKIVSAGIFIRQTRKHVELAANYDAIENHDSCKISIPRGMIQSIRFVKTLKV